MPVLPIYLARISCKASEDVEVVQTFVTPGSDEVAALPKISLNEAKAALLGAVMASDIPISASWIACVQRLTGSSDYACYECLTSMASTTMAERASVMSEGAVRYRAFSDRVEGRLTAIKEIQSSASGV